MISRPDRYAYPVGRRRLEPIGVLVFSVIMITSFFQVGIEGVSRLSGTDHSLVQLTVPAVTIMASTVVIKGICWLYCRLIRNSSVQALAQDAMTDVVFNTFSILFPLVGYFAKVWWLDALGGILLSAYVIINWSRTSAEHIRNLTGASATADERNILLYMTMRFAKSIKRIQGLQAYHAGDKLNVEVDIVVDENLALRDSHDLGESLQYVLGESIIHSICTSVSGLLLIARQKAYPMLTELLCISTILITTFLRTCRNRTSVFICNHLPVRITFTMRCTMFCMIHVSRFINLPPGSTKTHTPDLSLSENSRGWICRTNATTEHSTHWPVAPTIAIMRHTVNS